MVGKPWRWLLGSRVLREVASERALQVPRPRSCCGALCFLSKTFIQSGHAKTPQPRLFSLSGTKNVPDRESYCGGGGLFGAGGCCGGKSCCSCGVSWGWGGNTGVAGICSVCCNCCCCPGTEASGAAFAGSRPGMTGCFVTVPVTASES